AAHVDAAKETIILERRSHIDSLIHKLRDPRVAKILSPMLAGGDMPGDVLDDDVAYVVGLGIVPVGRGECLIPNPIYREGPPPARPAVGPAARHPPADRVVPPPRRLARHAQADGRLADVLAQGRSPRRRGVRLPRVRAAPDVDGVPPARGERRRPRGARVRAR